MSMPVLRKAVTQRGSAASPAGGSSPVAGKPAIRSLNAYSKPAASFGRDGAFSSATSGARASRSPQAKRRQAKARRSSSGNAIPARRSAHSFHALPEYSPSLSIFSVSERIFPLHRRCPPDMGL